jgi:sigma-E factor negative regulatory protein RseC
MKEQFEVIEVENQTMTLKVNRSSGCNSCSAQSGCGTGILAKYFEHYSVFNKPLKTGVSVGDLVTLEISSTELFYRAFQLYMMPLLALFAASILGDNLYPNQEGIQIVFAFSGFFASLLLTKYFVK